MHQISGIILRLHIDIHCELLGRPIDIFDCEAGEVHAETIVEECDAEVFDILRNVYHRIGLRIEFSCLLKNIIIPETAPLYETKHIMDFP